MSASRHNTLGQWVRAAGLLGSLVGVAACSPWPDSPREPLDASRGPHPVRATEANTVTLTFSDDINFEQRLAERLGSSSAVAVLFIPPVPRAQIPDRLERWLYAARHAGGTIHRVRPAAATAVRTRSTAWTSPGLVTPYGTAPEAVTHAVQGFDVLIDQTSDDLVHRATFVMSRPSAVPE